jgi:hypothetical protein
VYRYISVGRCRLNKVDPYPITYSLSKPINYNLSSEKTGFKVCLSNFNLQRYSEVAVDVTFCRCVSGKERGEMVRLVQLLNSVYPY